MTVVSTKFWLVRLWGANR